LYTQPAQLTRGGSAAAYARARESVLRICRGEADARTLRLEALDAIRRAVSFDAYAWLLTDPETSVGSSPLADVPCLPQLPQLIRLKYLTAVNRWTGLPSAVASLHEATGGNLSRSLMWRELLGRYEVTDIASSVYRDRFGCWGFLDLWRIGTPAFGEADIEFLDGQRPGVRIRPGVRPDAARDRTSPVPRRRRRHPRGRPADVRVGEHCPGSPQVHLRQEHGPQPARPARPGARHLTAFLACAVRLCAKSRAR